jgi:hypothetical protein
MAVRGLTWLSPNHWKGRLPSIYSAGLSCDVNRIALEYKKVLEKNMIKPLALIAFSLLVVIPSSLNAKDDLFLLKRLAKSQQLITQFSEIQEIRSDICSAVVSRVLISNEILGSTESGPGISMVAKTEGQTCEEAFIARRPWSLGCSSPKALMGQLNKIEAMYLEMPGTKLGLLENVKCLRARGLTRLVLSGGIQVDGRLDDRFESVVQIEVSKVSHVPANLEVGEPISRVDVNRLLIQNPNIDPSYRNPTQLKSDSELSTVWPKPSKPHVSMIAATVL